MTKNTYFYKGIKPELFEIKKFIKLKIIMAITLEKVLGYMIYKPGVKSANFLIFIIELI